MKTIRQRIITLLMEEPSNALQISMAVGIPEKEVCPHLYHIEKSVRSKGGSLNRIPAQCMGCGYVFKHRNRLSSPSKCPECRSTHIQDPVFKIQ